MIQGFYVDKGIDKIQKDAESELDYTRDWTEWLESDTIEASDLTDVNTDVAMTAVSGDAGTITSTLIDLTVNFKIHNIILISGFTNAINNGLFRVTATPLAGSLAVKKVNGDTLINEAAGPSVTIKNPASTWIVPAPLYEPKVLTKTTTSATVWLGGGVVGSEYIVTNYIRTVGERKDERSFTVVVVQK